MKRKVAVVAGGDSGEYSISISSGRMVYQELDREKYEPYFVVIHGLDWHVETDEGIKYPVNRNDFSFSRQDEKVRFDVAFIAIHGTPGEDGLLQGYFDLVRIPYTSCSLLVSALTFNKNVCKQVVSGLGIPVAVSVYSRKGETIDQAKIINQLGLPVFVKPNCSGSSVGVSKVKLAEELGPAIDKAFELDDEVLVEAFMPGREITCGVIREGGRLIAFPVTEIIPKNEFFDYEAKYKEGMSEEVVPANIPDSIANRCREMSLFLFSQLNCRGVVRFDYIFRDDTIRFLEVNSVPGLTQASIVPKMARAYGWTTARLFDKLIENALQPIP
ncbi:MAG: D-alanine--D-alanine ligase [Bacteroidetes bacterium]|nr:D-alanine--D-alanine ligase [Bacteroidota bacterium]